MKPLDGTSADSPEERLVDVIFGVLGACEPCLPRRVPATYVLWESIVGEQLLAEIASDGEIVYPHSICGYVCVDCCAEARASNSDQAYVVVVRKLTPTITTEKPYA